MPDGVMFKTVECAQENVMSGMCLACRLLVDHREV